MTIIADPHVIRKYMTLQAAWFASAGLQMVLFPYLVVDQLGLEPEVVGFAQAMIALPAFLLMLPGGALADRFDGRSILLFTYLFAALPPLLLASTLFLGGFQFAVVLAYGIAMGTFGAFSTPARIRFSIAWSSPAAGKCPFSAPSCCHPCSCFPARSSA